ncbi:MAG: cell division protein FtsX [Calditrichota bacterium]
MSIFGLAFRLGWGTLRSRPTLSILAVGLLALGTALMTGLFGTVFLLRNLQSQFLTAMTVELELVKDTDSSRVAVMARAEAWPGVEFVQYLSPPEVLQEVQKETGEDLQGLFGVNPFPALVRVRFAQTDMTTLDQLTKEASAWSEISEVVYPRTLWSDLQRLASRVQSKFGWPTALFAIVVIGLVGLCLRAQVRNLRATWEFLILSGMSRQTMSLSLLVQAGIVGLIAGLIACGLLSALTSAYSLLLLRDVAFPLWFHLSVILVSVLLAVIAGLFSPRKALLTS